MNSTDLEQAEKRRLARNRYMRERRKKNPKKVKKHQEDFWDRKAKELEKKGDI